MVKYDNVTYDHLVNFTKVANSYLKSKVFELNFLGYPPHNAPPITTGFRAAYHHMFDGLMKYPYNRYLKSDDDIVYVHPNAFRLMIERKNSRDCFMHFANIITNWQCSVKHQELGIYDNEEINPYKLKFEFSSIAYCGLFAFECAELSLRSFVHYYNEKQLDKYMFSGRELLVKKNASPSTCMCWTRI